MRSVDSRSLRRRSSLPRPCSHCPTQSSSILSVKDLRSLRTVNRGFCACATPAAFRTVGATNRRDSALGLVSLLESGLRSMWISLNRGPHTLMSRACMKVASREE
ncbi:hypothetical protein FA95DRAFT_626626 [Auriscalpium vulgare]|uniref:Uncharacterized protein n=1 Tax=Auriscalpium vulgare TaxID=40419 RepID=A0ACB8RD79_9AGAM|nr:hypothetical protein FA95DRAFT_626626 [Auriscalpium vulgare]